MDVHKGYGSARQAPHVEEKKQAHTILMSPDPNPLKHEGRFLCNVRFNNDLPEIPSDPKMLLPPLDPAALAAFSLTSLERAARRDLRLESNLGISLTALDVERFSLPPAAQRQPLDPRDAALLADEGEAAAGAAAAAAAGGAGAGAQRSRLRGDAAEVSWLLRTKYITTDAGDAGRRAGRAKPEAAGAAAAAEAAGTLEGQVAAIEASFAAARRPPVHAKHPGLTPVEVLPILPDALLAGWSCVLAVFDGDPAAEVERLAGMDAAARARVAAAAQLKSFVRRKADGGVDRFVAMMLPAAPPRAAGEEGAGAGAGAGAGEGAAPLDPGVSVPAAALQGDYQWVREYDSQVRYDERGQTFLFRLAGDHVGYSDLSTKVALRKRKRGGGGGGGDEDDAFLQPEKFVLALPGAEGAAGGGEAQGEEGGEAGQDPMETALEPAAAAAAAAAGERPQAATLHDVFGSDDDDV